MWNQLIILQIDKEKGEWKGKKIKEKKNKRRDAKGKCGFKEQGEEKETAERRWGKDTQQDNSNNFSNNINDGDDANTIMITTITVVATAIVQ